jgi:hypothetical protein
MQIRTFFALGLLFFSSSAIAGRVNDGTARFFDKPVKTVKIPLAPDPDNPQAKPMLSCFYYRGFMVKEIDRGEVGAYQLSIIPAAVEEPKCAEANIASEKALDAKEWSGYFKGVKGDYVFFDADDGFNGGLGFAVYHGVEGKKLFDDIAKSWRTIAIKNGRLQLRYVRTYLTTCSTFADAKGCWAKIQQSTGLTKATPPDCSAAYKAEQKRMQGDKRITPLQIAANPTVIYYEAETVLEGPQHKTAALPGRLACQPAA